MPNIADCGGLIIGADKKLPKTPPLEMVKFPPVISSKVSWLNLAFSARDCISFSIYGIDFPCKSLKTGTTNPLGEETATEIST